MSVSRVFLVISLIPAVLAALEIGLYQINLFGWAFAFFVASFLV